MWPMRVMTPTPFVARNSASPAARSYANTLSYVRPRGQVTRIDHVARVVPTPARLMFAPPARYASKSPFAPS